jgi:hypothetical protein
LPDQIDQATTANGAKGTEAREPSARPVARGLGRLGLPSSNLLGWCNAWMSLLT